MCSSFNLPLSSSQWLPLFGCYGSISCIMEWIKFSSYTKCRDWSFIIHLLIFSCALKASKERIFWKLRVNKRIIFKVISTGFKVTKINMFKRGRNNVIRTQTRYDVMKNFFFHNWISIYACLSAYMLSMFCTQWAFFIV